MRKTKEKNTPYTLAKYILAKYTLAKYILSKSLPRTVCSSFLMRMLSCFMFACFFLVQGISQEIAEDESSLSDTFDEAIVIINDDVKDENEENSSNYDASTTLEDQENSAESKLLNNPIKLKKTFRIEASVNSKRETITFSLSVPAPRGQIVDRYGRPLANNKLAHYLGLKIPKFDEASREEVVAFARNKIAKANAQLGTNFSKTEEDIWDHYRERPWLKLLFVRPLSENQISAIKAMDDPALSLHPLYLRNYPEEALAGHIVGHVGKIAPLAKGVPSEGEPLWELTEGRNGLESSFNEYLRGKNGRMQILFNKKGETVNAVINEQAVAGDTIVSTLDIDMQRIAEGILRRTKRRGAFVVLDVHKGETLAMASWPCYNPNDYIPTISQEKFDKLVNDKSKPLLPRAYQGVYPPASTFKILTVLAALNRNVISEYTQISCPGSIWVGNRRFNNWHRNSEGSFGAANAIKRSCNTWMIQASFRAGSSAVISMAERFGLGIDTGIELPGEAAGFLPTNEFYRKKYGHPVLQGNLANICIGQGEVLATPLQVARMMAGVARGDRLPKPHIVKQIQNVRGEVLEVYDSKKEEQALNLNNYDLKVVRKGMYLVINSKYGTGKRAANRYATTVGKTGTGQWKPKQGQEVAWFAGYAPYKNPKIAFATIYEGRPGERVSGGKIAAPMVSSFLSQYDSLLYKRRKNKQTLFAQNTLDENADQKTKSSSSSSSSSSNKKIVKAKKKTNPNKVRKPTKVYQTDFYNKRGGMGKVEVQRKKSDRKTERRGIFSKISDLFKRN